MKINQIEKLNIKNINGLIWITGLSGSGKTTIGRKVERNLKNSGMSTVFLDGDDLRSIFGSNWGYERNQRIDLAHVYFRLASHLASQGLIVIVSAIAIYKEIFDWVNTNIPRNLKVYLDVPEDERRRRDAVTKGIYKTNDLTSIYDSPDGVDHIEKNYGDAKTEDIAFRISEAYLNLDEIDSDMGRKSHWTDYYKTAIAPTVPSSFAQYALDYINESSKILEVGCGNGRDSTFFDKLGNDVHAIDLCESVIAKCKNEHVAFDVKFSAGKVSDIYSQENYGSFDCVYSRFVLHAMPLNEEIETIGTAYKLLKYSGIICIECRSINDPMARIGEVISPTERINGHYRRFIVFDDLISRLEKVGFTIVSAIESNGLAKYINEDPVVIRVIARK